VTVYIYTLFSDTSRWPSNSISNEVKTLLPNDDSWSFKSNYELLLNNCIDGFQTKWKINIFCCPGFISKL